VLCCSTKSCAINKSKVQILSFCVFVNNGCQQCQKKDADGSRVSRSNVSHTSSSQPSAARVSCHRPSFKDWRLASLVKREDGSEEPQEP
jgi:hypothetical protein